jgi:hypothetical protein
MFGLIRTKPSFRMHPYQRLSTGSVYVHLLSHREHAHSKYRIPKDGIYVQVGKAPKAQTVHISPAALGASRVLRERLSEGVRIINVDPIVFKVALRYIERSGFVARWWPHTKDSFDELTSGDESILNLVKAWHLGYMLDLPRMQNKVIEAFRKYHNESLKSPSPVPLSQEPFNHLRSHIGWRTKCERLLFDFYASLAFHRKDYCSEELEQLPHDTARELLQRRARMAVDKKLANYIAKNNVEYQVAAGDNWLPATLQILPPRRPSTPSVPLPRSSSTPVRPVRPPFWVDSPLQRRRRARTQPESESSDDSECYMFPSPLQRQDQ